MKNKLLIILFSLFVNLSVFAQSDTTLIVKKIKNNEKLMIQAVPVVSSSPTTGFLFGATASLAKYFGSVETTHLSSAVFGAIHTSKNQTFISLKSTAFLKNDAYYLIGDWRYLINSLPNYGLGTGPQSAKLAASTGFNYQDNMWSKPIPGNQQMYFRHLRLHEVIMKRINESHFFIGGGYRLDAHNHIKDEVLNLTDSPKVITSHYAYSIANGFNPEKYVLSSLSLDAVFDSRDNTANPYKGRYVNFSYRISPTFIGSSKNSSSLWLEYRDYISLSKKTPRHLIGFWTYTHFQTTGTHGYLDLPSTGFDQYSRSARPYTQGRFRGEKLLYGETEYRFPIWKYFGGVAYINGMTASNQNAGINLFKYVDYGYGIGLRWMANKKARTNITIDYGFGKYGAQGFILNFAETF